MLEADEMGLVCSRPWVPRILPISQKLLDDDLRLHHLTQDELTLFQELWVSGPRSVVIGETLTLVCKQTRGASIR